MKTCSKCGIEQPLNNFYKNNRNKDLHNNACKLCDAIYSKEYYLKNKNLIIQKTSEWAKQNPDKKKRISKKSHLNKKYKISIEEEQQLKEKQKFLCAICKNKLLSGHKTHIDHCHVTGKIRGLLCNGCNRALGFFKDNISYLKNAIKYLRKYQ